MLTSKCSEKLKYSSEKYIKFLIGKKYVILRDQLIKAVNKKLKNINKL